MHKSKRQELVLEKLKVNGRVGTQNLATELEVSEDTIRRDLNELANKGLLSKVHGGAVSSIQKLYFYNDNVVRNQEEKNCIAQKALSLVNDGMSIIISDGTTNLALARSLPRDLKATIFTYCLPIAMELTEHPEIEIIFLGGKVEKKSMVSIGPNVVREFENIHADLCFLGTGSIGYDEGISEGNYEVALIKKTIVSVSDRVVSLTTTDKIGLRQTYRICRPGDIDILVTELDPAHRILERFSQRGIQVI